MQMALMMMTIQEPPQRLYEQSVQTEMKMPFVMKGLSLVLTVRADLGSPMKLVLLSE